MRHKGATMSLLSKVKNLLGKNEQTTTAPLLSFSVIPAAKMVQREDPFNDWRPTEEAIPENLSADFQGCVWMYQMYVFFILAEARFGTEIAEVILGDQVGFLEQMTLGMGRQLKEGVEKIRAVVSTAAETPLEIEANGQKVAVPIDYAVAYAFFPNQSWADAQSLVRCLEHGKYSAREAFEPFIQATKIENGNVTVSFNSRTSP
jgi:hypothetical protein